MCGIAGFIDCSRSMAQDAGSALLRQMADRLAHRGPDDEGYWCDESNGVFLAHRRLSIVDLSAAGHQPMRSTSGRFVIVFNGEIYNHRALRAELDGRAARTWRGHSDTEVLLAAFEAWGIEGALRRAVGMFAIAAWDRDACQLTLVRDRAGEKPLYFGNVAGKMVFASELKAIEALPRHGLDTDPAAVSLLLRFGYIPAPHSIYRQVRKIMPGTWMRFGPDGGLVAEGAYWSAHESASRGAVDPTNLPASACVDKLEKLLMDAVKLQLEADVPVGAFLSGGIDSSTVVALAQKCLGSRVRTFTVGFAEQEFDESSHAREVAAHIGTDHTELMLSSADALDAIPEVARAYDEPFADSSQIPTYLVSRLARQSVTVSLSGDGGDELFGGYPRYQRAESLSRLINRVPQTLRQSVSRTTEMLAPDTWTRLAAPLSRWVPASAHRSVGDRVYRVAEMLRSSPEGLFGYLASALPNPSALTPDIAAVDTLYDRPSAWPRLGTTSDVFMWLDFMTYLPDNVLAKLDRASMAVSLESRVPLLDHRVIEFAHRLPVEMKMNGTTTKWILRQVLKRHVPDRLIDRPKMGFSLPLGAWLRGPLRAWAHDRLFSSRPHDDGIDEAAVRRMWNESQSGARNWEHVLWNILMLREWQHHHVAS